MRDQITALESLQRLDLELRELEDNLKKYPQELSRHKQELEDIGQLIGRMKEELEQDRKKKSAAELSLARNQDSIKKAEQKLFEIKTFKEYEALQKEIGEAKRLNSEYEEQILKEMEEVERLEKSIEEKEKELSVKSEEFEPLAADYNAKIDELKIEYDIKKAEKDKLAALLPADMLSTYQRIKKKNGIALASARDEVCTGCNMNIPPQLFNEVLTLSRVIQCPNCQRILYTEEIVDEELQTA